MTATATELTAAYTPEDLTDFGSFDNLYTLPEVPGIEDFVHVGEGVWVTVATITPEFAEAALARMCQNRNLDRRRVVAYSNDLTSGRWHLSHQGLAFNDKGELIDGQHRLAAIIRTQIPAVMLVAAGFNDEVKLVLDSGQSRSAAQAFAIAGKRMTNNEIAIAKGMLANYENGNRQQFLSVQQLADWIDQVKPAVDIASQRYSQYAIAVAPVRSTVAKASYYCKEDRLKQFLRVLDTGLVVDPKKDAAAVTLRNYCLAARKTVSTSQANVRVDLMQKTTSAIRSFMAGEPLAVLRPTRTDIYALPDTLLRP